MISEGSCATEDWNNDAENSALQLNLRIYENRKQLFYIIIIFHIITVFICIFYQIYAALVGIRDFQKP